MTKLDVKNLTLIFGNRKKQAFEMLEQGVSKKNILKKTHCIVAVNDATFSVQEGEIFVIMGLSGSGKSSLIRCFNKLNKPISGSITLDDKEILKMDEKELLELRRHGMSMVFQHFGLLPHRSVISNVAFGLEIHGVDKETRENKALETIKVVGLEGYEYKMCGELSGGMQQRVGLARALATDPEILLMDEAFSALDPLIRNQMQDELIELQKKVHKTILFITHDLDEALKLGDRIAIMKDGKIVQIGTPEDIIVEPADDYVSAFVENVDRSNFITVSSVMFTKITKINIDRDGPHIALKRMTEKGLNRLPVVDKNNIFQGFVLDNEVGELVKKDEKSVRDIIIKDVPMVLPDTYVSDVLPLYIEYDLPVAVVNEDRKLLGLAVHSTIISEIIGIEREEILKIKKEGGNVNG
jgi:glycine betaine/proline transport system ATP-binding protein